MQAKCIPKLTLGHDDQQWVVNQPDALCSEAASKARLKEGERRSGKDIANAHTAS